MRNLAAAVSTLAEGLLYLLAFVFIISGVGLTLLGAQTMLADGGDAQRPVGGPGDAEDDAP